MQLASVASSSPRLSPAVDVTPRPVLVGYDVEGRTWRTGPSDVTVADLARSRRFVVPALTRTDLSSVPRALWWLVAPFELTIAAPVVHDWLYRHGGRVPMLEGAADGFTWLHAVNPYTRAEADALFGALLEAEGVAAWRRRAALAAVRLFGGKAWRPAPVAPAPTVS